MQISKNFTNLEIKDNNNNKAMFRTALAELAVKNTENTQNLLIYIT